MSENVDKLGNYLSRIALFTTAISVVTFAVGCYIINTSLADYQIQDFDLVKPRAVITGFTFLLLLSTNIALYFVVPGDVINPEPGIGKLMGYNAIKVPYIAISIFILCYGDLAENEFCQFNLFGKELDHHVNMVFELIFLFSGFLQLYIYLRMIENKVGKIIVNTITTIACVYLSLLYFWIFEFTFFLVLQFGIYHLTMTYIKHIRGNLTPKIEDAESDAINRVPKDDRKRRMNFKNFKAKHTTLLKVAYVLFAIIIFLVIATYYTSYFYPKIHQSLGGGELERITYTTSTDTVAGEKIYETEEFVFIKANDSVIRKLDWKDVTSIVKKNKWSIIR
jgi:hypothetical protein